MKRPKNLAQTMKLLRLLLDLHVKIPGILYNCLGCSSNAHARVYLVVARVGVVT